MWFEKSLERCMFNSLFRWYDLTGYIADDRLMGIYVRIIKGARRRVRLLKRWMDALSDLVKDRSSFR